jgi:hypothetical protein
LANANLMKRIERLEARRPAAEPQLDGLLWRAMATFGVDDRERQILLDHADAVDAGRAHGEPPEPVDMWLGIPPAAFDDAGSRHQLR